jgi:hypothetical protein
MPKRSPIPTADEIRGPSTPVHHYSRLTVLANEAGRFFVGKVAFMLMTDGGNTSVQISSRTWDTRQAAQDALDGEFFV